MRPIRAVVFLSLDGVVQAPGGSTEDSTGGFRLGGWTLPQGDAQSTAALASVFTKGDDHLLGRRTYGILPLAGPSLDPITRLPEASTR